MDCMVAFPTRSDMLPTKIVPQEIIDLTVSPEPEPRPQPQPRPEDVAKSIDQSSKAKANELLTHLNRPSDFPEERPRKKIRYQECDRQPLHGGLKWQTGWVPGRPKQSRHDNGKAGVDSSPPTSFTPSGSILQPAPSRVINSGTGPLIHGSRIYQVQRSKDVPAVTSASQESVRQPQPAAEISIRQPAFKSHETFVNPVPKQKVAPEDSTPDHADARKDINDDPQPSSTKGSEPYTDEDRQLLLRLKGLENRSWDEIARYFPNRSRESIQTHYSTKVKRLLTGNCVRSKKERKPLFKHEQEGGVRGRPLARDSAVSRQDSSASIDHHQRSKTNRSPVAKRISQERFRPGPHVTNEHAYPNSLSRLLRVRELGATSRRAWSTSKTVTNEMKNHAYRGSEFIQYYQGMSGDVVALNWSSDDNLFAAGSIAISDPQSQQYNMGRNLLLGNLPNQTVHELPEHHVARPWIDERNNVNASHAMRATQDERLFMTVTGTEFSADSRQLYTSSADGTLRRYIIDVESNLPRHDYEIKHEAAVDLLSVHHGSGDSVGIVATAARRSTENISIYECRESHWDQHALYSPFQQMSHDVFPSALRFGHAPQHRDFLLAGFGAAGDKDLSGQTCLWNINIGTHISLHAVTHDVLDVAWNPAPSSSSVAFVVACNPSGIDVNKSTRSVIQCFAPSQQECRRVLIWECPARDINRVVFCPHDDNLVAAGATDGRVYVWDKRFAGRDQKPLHALEHGESLNVLAPDEDREMTDTGVHFIAWGATRERLYSGSSDGIVKTWNPYLAVDKTHIDDIAVPRAQRSAIMSGAFSNDSRSLLIGTENGNVNLFSIGSHELSGVVRNAAKFKLISAKAPVDKAEDPPFQAAKDMLQNGEIVIRPCGGMPFRQAVQGPYYKGPYVDPPHSEISAAMDEYEKALEFQAKEISGDSMMQTHVENDDGESARNSKRIVDAQREVSRAQSVLSDLQRRAMFAQPARMKAESFQRSLLEMEQQRLASNDPAQNCQLNCAVLRTAEDINDDVEDSARWELRLPTRLRQINRMQPIKGGQEKPDHTQQEIARQVGLLGICSKCQRPARIASDGSRALCERCDFSCFRCGQPASVFGDSAQITCSQCKLTWEVGVLGYELLDPPKPRRVAVRDQDEMDELAENEREHYASLWRTSDYHL
jgi:WD40 repeat protein